jgi:hypothetical protein
MAENMAVDIALMLWNGSERTSYASKILPFEAQVRSNRRMRG